MADGIFPGSLVPVCPGSGSCLWGHHRHLPWANHPQEGGVQVANDTAIITSTAHDLIVSAETFSEVTSGFESDVRFFAAESSYLKPA